jgi:hypothetical protein
MIKYIIIISIVVAAALSALLLLDTQSLNHIQLPTSSTSIHTYPDYVTEGCHPALSPNRTYYEICP